MSNTKDVHANLSQQELFTLHEHYQPVVRDMLGFCYQYLNFYVGLLSAILAATLTGLLIKAILDKAISEQWSAEKVVLETVKIGDTLAYARNTLPGGRDVEPIGTAPCAFIALGSIPASGSFEASCSSGSR